MERTEEQLEQSITASWPLEPGQVEQSAPILLSCFVVMESPIVLVMNSWSSRAKDEVIEQTRFGYHYLERRLGAFNVVIEVVNSDESKSAQQKRV